MELEELMQQRPLRLAVATLERVAASATSSRADAVRHKGVTKFQSAVAVQTAAEVLELVFLGLMVKDWDRCAVGTKVQICRRTPTRA